MAVDEHALKREATEAVRTMFLYRLHQLDRRLVTDKVAGNVGDLIVLHLMAAEDKTESRAQVEAVVREEAERRAMPAWFLAFALKILMALVWEMLGDERE